MSNIFNSIRVKKPKLNRFNLSHNVKTTGKFGKLIPFMCVPTLPGDIFKNNTESLIRFAPMLAPIMHEVNVYTHFFFVPNRLVWTHWRDFITGGEDGYTTPSYPRYQFNSAIDVNSSFHQFVEDGSLMDYLGFPTVRKNEKFEYDGEFDALPFRAYHLIWNEYYRDENLQDPVDIDEDVDGVVDVGSYGYLLKLQNRAWKKDYFTSALPFAQRGEDIVLPVVRGIAPIELTGRSGSVTNNTLSSAQLGTMLDGVNLNDVNKATIVELRRAIKAQEFLEACARGGSRYIEQIYSLFGVKSSDARLQRPEFIGGGKSPVMINDVLQTSQTTETSPQASPSGHALSVQNTHTFKYRCEEHGYIIGIMSIMPKPAYQQGISRLFSKFDRLDYYWPQFAHLGEQEIKNKELYVDLTQSKDNSEEETFGYTPRYAEYKYMSDSVHGDFRGSLNFWHMGRIFDNQPLLNEDFITNVSNAANRVFAVTNADYDLIWINIHNNLKALRPMPKYGTPMI